VLIVIQTIVIQEQNIIVKALDFYYRDRSKCYERTRDPGTLGSIAT
jgi:hypothetical protein